MLRAMTTDTPFEQRWVLQGRLCGEWAADVAQQWEKTRNTRQGRRCVVDVDDVVAADDKGEQLLLQMMSEGCQVVASRVYMKHRLESLKDGRGRRWEETDVSRDNTAR
jgi:ABC-type transporter Mla MlaB component